MLSNKSLILMLALVACETTEPQPTHASNDVISLSRDAVAVQEPDAEPVSEPARDDGVLLGTAMLTDPVVSEPVVEAVSMATFTLRHGETLDHFARWSGYPV